MSQYLSFELVNKENPKIKVVYHLDIQLFYLLSLSMSLFSLISLSNVNPRINIPPIT